MAYTKQTWNDLPNTTTPVTATRLNHIEDGIETANTLATTSVDGLMSSSDKTKLNRIGMTKLFDGKINAPNTSFQLSQNYDNFDLLIFTCSVSSAYKGRVTTFTIIPATIAMSTSSACWCFSQGNNTYAQININMTDKKTITTGGEIWGEYFTLNRVDGIKF